MNSTARKTIDKETQEAIKRLLTTNVHFVRILLLHSVCLILNKNFLPLQMSPSTPKLELDHNFSQILQKKREEQLEASKLSNMSKSKCDSSTESSGCEQKNNIETNHRAIGVEVENSMLFDKTNKSLFPDGGDESFLALERQCNVNDKEQRLNVNENETILFDIEPPSELWNQTANLTTNTTNYNDISEDDILNETEDDNLDKTEDENEHIGEHENGDETIEMSPVKYIGLIRPSTIIEETSSQFESSSKNSSKSDTKSSLYKTASTINDSENDELKISCEPTAKMPNEETSRTDRQKRRTFAFKRTNHVFFPDVNLSPINECAAVYEDGKTPIKMLQNNKTNEYDENSIKNEDQFNNTLERVDFLLEKGKQMIEESANANRSSLHHSLLETPTFSCKRKRLLNEMASMEMLPLAKREPLIDHWTSNILNQKRFNK